MALEQIKQKLQEAEAKLQTNSIVLFGQLSTKTGDLEVFITDRLYKQCRKGKIWKSRSMLSTLKNAIYGFDIKASRSRGGLDGIFRIDRNFSPKNSMMKKIFHFLDKPDPLVVKISKHFDTSSENWIPVRLVSHNLRLLGVMLNAEKDAQLVLVDYDKDKGN